MVSHFDLVPTPGAVSLPTPADVRAAYERIKSGIVLTPCVPALGFSDAIPCTVHLKLESLQRTGSFKDRGSLNRILDLTPEQKQRGVVTASAGNHAQAVAYHCGRLGIPAAVVMPEATPLIKITNTRRYGARITQVGATLSDSMSEAQRMMSEEGLTMIHPFDDDRVIEGQGTIAFELIDQRPDLSVVVVPIGGGGLIGGIGSTLKQLGKDVRVIGVEAAAAPSARASRQAGSVVHIETSETIADGIAVKRIGERTFPLIEEFVDEIVTVDETEIAAAIHLLIERQKLIAEGAGAVALAALLARKVDVKQDDVAVLVVSGGNIDVNIIQRIIQRGLVREGRLTHLVVKMRDRPGSLARLTRMIAEAGANVLETVHRRAFADISVGEVEIEMHLETRGNHHVEEILELLKANGLTVEENA
jgi:threonine dehydratase